MGDSQFSYTGTAECVNFLKVAQLFSVGVTVCFIVFVLPAIKLRYCPLSANSATLICATCAWHGTGHGSNALFSSKPYCKIQLLSRAGSTASHAPPVKLNSNMIFSTPRISH